MVGLLIGQNQVRALSHVAKELDYRQDHAPILNHHSMVVIALEKQRGYIHTGATHR